MPFGLKHAGATYQRAMLKLNTAKCTFGARSGKLLVFVVSERGIEIDSDKFILQLTEKCDPTFRLPKKHNLGKWDVECQRAFDKVKKYLSNPPVLSPPSSDRPLILYLAVFDNSMGCALGQHDESGRKEMAIYYLSKKFTECELRYPSIEKLCCTLIWTARRLRQYMLYHTTWLNSKLDPLKYMMESNALNERMARWKILLSEFDTVYVSQKPMKGSAIAEFLASKALEDYEPLNFDFPNKELMYVAAIEEDITNCHPWKLNFDGASNTVAIECKIKVLEVYEDSVLVIYQLRGEWKTRDSKMINYRSIVLGLIDEFGDITFNYLPRKENQMADALATLASMINVSKHEAVKPIQMSIFEAPSYCYDIEEEERDDHPWYQDILRYVRNREYPNQATENDKRTLKRLACDYALDGEILYKRRKDQVLLRCVDAVEAKKILEEVHEGVCGTHANGFTMVRQIMRFGFYWSTIDGDCINYAKKCHKCQDYGDKIHVPPSHLHVMTSLWPFSMWGMDVIGSISL
ncbi:uncharacterized protein LOC108458979 [Gossypium arboreum]|uniref:uncharacterized protein LOC108458979 n=1 Tax=Gossypium arboreum TaxID=29729 RepID=UPI0008192A9C|nr:uncharacterized protein LOC108458979 [Gossypium arboreum]